MDSQAECSWYTRGQRLAPTHRFVIIKLAPRSAHVSDGNSTVNGGISEATQVDLKDAYLHNIDSPGLQEVCEVCIYGDHVCQFLALPFGLTSAHLVITKVISVLVTYTITNKEPEYTYLPGRLAALLSPDGGTTTSSIVCGEFLHLFDSKADPGFHDKECEDGGCLSWEQCPPWSPGFPMADYIADLSSLGPQPKTGHGYLSLSI